MASLRGYVIKIKIIFIINQKYKLPLCITKNASQKYVLSLIMLNTIVYHHVIKFKGHLGVEKYIYKREE